MHRAALEVVAGEAHVGVEPGRVGVEVQEGARPPVEGARTLLDQSVESPEARQQALELDQVVGGGVAHGVHGIERSGAEVGKAREREACLEV